MHASVGNPVAQAFWPAYRLERGVGYKAGDAAELRSTWQVRRPALREDAWRCCRASLGPVGQEAYLTGGRRESC